MSHLPMCKLMRIHRDSYSIFNFHRDERYHDRSVTPCEKRSFATASGRFDAVLQTETELSWLPTAHTKKGLLSPSTGRKTRELNL